MSDNPGMLDASQLQLNDPPSIAWVLVRQAINLLWVDNPKLHDIGAVCTSIQKYGFQEQPKFDKNLPNRAGGQGAIKAGNGRVEALDWMERSGEYELPRGLALTKDDQWAMPIIVGTDAETIGMAIAYAVDSNNLVMSGGDFTLFQSAMLWDGERYKRILSQFSEDELPVSIDAESLQMLLGEYPLYQDDRAEAEADIGMGKQFLVKIEDVHFLEPALSSVRELLDAHPEWKASIAL